jgi:ech hydrogenase subunit C
MQRPTNELVEDDAPRVLRFDCGGCGGCYLETASWLMALSDAGRVSLVRASSLERVDVLLVTGAALRRDALRLRRFYQRITPAPVVVAVGACSLSGGVFAGAYGVAGGAGEVIPVDVFVPGCPPRADAVFDGVFQCIRALPAALTRIQPRLKIPA